MAAEGLRANQASAQLFIDGLTAGGPGSARAVNIGAYPAAPASSYAGLSESARSHDPANEALQQATFAVTLNPGQQVHLDLRLVTGTAPAQVQFRWVPPDNQAQSIAAAVTAAQAARKAVVFAYDEGTEGSDRGGSNQSLGLQLPGYQDALIAAVAAANPNTVVVLNTGDPVLMPWASSVKSILEMWYPGQEGGPATADVLLGKADPGGKLPVSFPPDGTHFPSYDPGCTDTTSPGTARCTRARQAPARSCPARRPATAPSPPWPSTASSRATAGTTSTTSPRCSPSATACPTPGSPTPG